MAEPPGNHADFTVEFANACGEAGCMCQITHGRIEIDRTSNQRERRDTLNHEMWHHKRGPVPNDPYLAMREEKYVEHLTAQSLVDLDDLLDAVIWDQAQVHDGTANELWVEYEILKTRVDRSPEKSANTSKVSYGDSRRGRIERHDK